VPGTAPVATAPTEQRAESAAAPVSLPSAGIGVQADTGLSRTWTLASLMLTTAFIGGAVMAGRRMARPSTATPTRLLPVRVRADAFTRAGRCRRCGASLSGRDNFCSACGATLVEFRPSQR
jgi:hypothetical protein